MGRDLKGRLSGHAKVYRQEMGKKQQGVGPRNSQSGRMVIQRDTGGGESDRLCQMLQIL